MPCSAISARSVLLVAKSARSKQARAKRQASWGSWFRRWYRALASQKFFLAKAAKSAGVTRRDAWLVSAAGEAGGSAKNNKSSARNVIPAGSAATTRCGRGLTLKIG